MRGGVGVVYPGPVYTRDVMSQSKQGAVAERAALRKLGGRLAHTSWHDLLAPGETPVEVKSAQFETSRGRPGRFRLWRSQHRKLKRNHGRYAFVLIAQGRVLRVKVVAPERVERLVESWSPSGHTTKQGDGEQAKVAWPRVIQSY
jgi:hypothetical protein